ncbi:hypothetical protein MSAN_02130400 [Mycena sanguinolenta]|uniref:ABM domain-containing protein n=1 Tax=Mycena sanguinolenta TaxID=230812 RepID=A0A8H6XH40_9AGAR|nr:hypothetical protein MSAN_02130400 [Mycena sanguinolenta]
MPAIQITTVPTSPDVFKASTDLIKAAPGHQSSFYGLKVEDEKIGYFVSVWDTHEHLAANPHHAAIIKPLAGNPQWHIDALNINITTDPLPALSSPAVEFAVFTLQAPDEATATQNQKRITELLKALGSGLDLAAAAHPPCFWGQSGEDENKFVMIVGWESVEAHIEFAMAGNLGEIVREIKTFARVSISHSNMTKD